MIKRKKRFDTAVNCSICKEKRAYHTVHGFRRYGGNTCCTVCFNQVKKEYEIEKKRDRDYQMTEADYIIERRL